MKGQLDNYYTRSRLLSVASDLRHLIDNIEEAQGGRITTNGIPQFRAKKGTTADLTRALKAVNRAFDREAK